jgi:small subunit ribosomal protein S14
MAKKSAVNRNEMVKRLAKRYEAKRAALKATANNESLPLEDRFEARLKLAEMPRIALRDLGSAGHIPGLVKSSW